MITGSERLILRHHRSEDTSSIFENYTRDRGSARYLARLPHSSIEQTERMLQTLSSPQSLALVGKCIWLIEAVKDGSAVGLVTIIKSDEAMEIHFGIGVPFRGHGYGAEALALAAQYLLATGQAENISSYTDVDNVAAQRALANAGFVFIERVDNVYQAPQLDGEPRDVYRYQFRV